MALPITSSKEEAVDHMAREQWLVRQDVGMTSHHPHERAAAALRADITTGTFAPGEALPGQRELADRYGVAQNTLGQALRLLEAEGLVEMAPRRRTRVLQPFPHLEVRLTDDGHLRPADVDSLGHADLHAGARTVDERAAEALHVPPGKRLFAHQATLLHAGTPWALLAQRELKDPFGFRVDEAYVAPPPPPPKPKPGAKPPPPPPPQSNQRRTEQPRKLEKPVEVVLPKL